MTALASSQGAATQTIERGTDTQTIDDYEDGSTSEYTTNDDTAFELATSTAHSGEYAFRALAGNGGRDYAIATPSANPDAPQAGDTFWLYYYPTETTSDPHEVIFGAQGDANTKPNSEQYRIRVKSDGDFRFYVHDGSSLVLLDSTTATVSIDGWNQVRVEWKSNGDFTINHYDANGDNTATLTANDATWTDGGFGYVLPASAAADRYYDTWQKLGPDDDGNPLTTSIDNFEDGDLSEYTFDKGGSGVQIVSNPTHNGATALEIADTNTEMISQDGLNHYPAAGERFVYRVRGANGADDINLSYGVQDHQNRYFVRVDIANNDLYLFRYEDDTSYQLAGQASGFTLGQDAWYHVVVSWSEKGRHHVTLLDNQQQKLATVKSVDQTWTEGGIGYDAYLDEGGTVYIDHVVSYGPCITKSHCIVDNFEDADLLEYNFDRGESGASITSSPVKHGSNALHLSGTNTEMVKMPRLSYYPSTGDTFSYSFKGLNGADDINLSYGVQDHENRYFVNVEIQEGAIRLARYENGSSTILDADSTFGLSEDTWYELEVDWADDGTHTITLYDASQTQLSQVSATDSTWTAGGVGYDAYLADGGTAYIDSVTTSDERTIDDFEDGSLLEYSFDQGKAGATVVSGVSNMGSYALRLKDATTELASLPSQACLPTTGDQFSYWVRGANGADDINLSYGVQDHENRYFVNVEIQEGAIRLARYENGSSTILDADSTFGLSEDTWYELEVDWTFDGTHTVSIYDANGIQLGECAAADSTWTDGGIGYDAYLSGGGDAYIDHVSFGPAGPLPNTATVTGGSSSSDYTMTVSGDILPGEYADSGDTISGSTVSGSVGSAGTDSFTFSGDVTQFKVTDYVDASIDYAAGTITLSDLRSSPSDTAEYTIIVSGTIRASSSVEDADSTDDGTATGSLYGDQDEYTFTGDFDMIDFETKLTVTLDREYSRVTENPHPQTSVEGLACVMAKDLEDNRIAFVTSSLSERYELYLATGVSSESDVPEELIRLTTSSCGAFDVEWVADNRLRYWSERGVNTVRIQAGTVIDCAVREQNKASPECDCDRGL